MYGVDLAIESRAPTLALKKGVGRYAGTIVLFGSEIALP
jgi:hypothetical protein